MKLVVSLIFSLSLTCGYAQKDVTYYYGDSTISATGFLYKGQPHGLWKNFYNTGTLKSVGKRFFGKLDSTWTFYFSTGQIKMQIQYDKGIKNGFTHIYKFDEDYGHYLATKKLYIDGKLHGKAYSYYPNGNIKTVTQYHEGEKSGYKISFSISSKPKSLTEFRNNKPVSFQRVNQLSDSLKTGTWIKLDDRFNIKNTDQYRDGKTLNNQQEKNKRKAIKYTIEGLNSNPQDTLFEGQYIDGIPVGRHISYDTAGLPIQYIEYDSLGRKREEGKIEQYKVSGEVTGYYPNGERKFTGSFKRNYKHGLWIYYFKNGVAIEQKGFYRYGKLHGSWYWFYKNGDTLRIENYRNGKREGTYISYDVFGNILQKGSYYNDQKQKKWFEKRGHVIFKGAYFDGERDGQWLGHYENGIKAFEGNYVRGKEQNKFIYYYPSGHKRRIEFYKFGKPVGHWQFFNQEGLLYKVKSFKKAESIYFKTERN